MLIAIVIMYLFIGMMIDTFFLDTTLTPRQSLIKLGLFTVFWPFICSGTIIMLFLANKMRKME